MAARTARRVTVYVHVTNPETAESVLLVPGDEVPRWASKLVTNPKCFAEATPATGAADDEAPAGAQAPAPRTPAKGKRAAAADEPPENDEAGDPPQDPDTGDGDEDGEPDPAADGDEPPTFQP